MRTLFIVISILLATAATAQDVAKYQYIWLTYAPNGAYVEQAIETIEAVSKIPTITTVEYRAGQSIVLQPGFQANAGAVFTAYIRPISDVSLKIRAYPNPFDQSAIIDFTLPNAAMVNLFIVNEKGQIVRRLVENSQLSAGQHQFEWKAEAVSPGVYIPVLKTERQQISDRLIKR